MQKVNDGQWFKTGYQPTKLKFMNAEAFLSTLYLINRIKFKMANSKRPGSKIAANLQQNNQQKINHQNT